MITIVGSLTHHIRPGNLGMEVRGEKLLVPVSVARVLEEMGARTLDATVAALENFPTAFLRAGLQPKELLSARDKAVAQLKPLLSDSSTKPLNGVKRTPSQGGSLHPAFLKRPE